MEGIIMNIQTLINPWMVSGGAGLVLGGGFKGLINQRLEE
jgi:hypothetical protein